MADDVKNVEEGLVEGFDAVFGDHSVSDSKDARKELLERFHALHPALAPLLGLGVGYDCDVYNYEGHHPVTGLHPEMLREVVEFVEETERRMERLKGKFKNPEMFYKRQEEWNKCPKGWPGRECDHPNCADATHWLDGVIGPRGISSRYLRSYSPEEDPEPWSMPIPPPSPLTMKFLAHRDKEDV